MILSGLKNLLQVSDRVSEEIEFWKQYKDQEILIRRHTLERPANGESRDKINQVTHVVKGTVREVRTTPPGFLLSNVSEYVYLSDFEIMSLAGQMEYKTLANGFVKQELRTVPEKFIAFSSIEQLEKAEDVDKATEPLRESSSYSGNNPENE